MTSKLPRLAFVLLGTMTALTFGGPLAIGYVLGGGVSPRWPPDRPIEWATVIGVMGLVLLLMLACLMVLMANRKAMEQSRPSATKPEKTGVEP